MCLASYQRLIVANSSGFTIGPSLTRNRRYIEWACCPIEEDQLDALALGRSAKALLRADWNYVGRNWKPIATPAASATNDSSAITGTGGRGAAAPFMLIGDTASDAGKAN